MATRKRKKSNWFVWLLLITVVGLVATMIAGKQMGWFGKSNSTKVSVDEVKLRTIVETVKASGKIYPTIEVAISPDVSGEVLSLTVEEGDTVAKGKLLATIEDDVYGSVVDRAVASQQQTKANLASAQARLEQAVAALDQLKIDNDRNELLFNEKIISRQNYETTKARYISGQADVKAAEQAVEAARYTVQSANASVKESRDNLKRTKIYAPMSGIVSVLNVEKGERVVGTAQMTGTEMMRIADFSKMEVRVDVSENDVLRVSKGDTAVIEVDAYVDKQFKGTVKQIASSAQGVASFTGDQVTNFTVKILIEKDSYADVIKAGRNIPFRPGMSASVEIETEKVYDVVAVPVQSVTTRSEDTENNTNANDNDLLEVVFLAENGKAVKKIIKTGIQDESYIEVKSGLKNGAEVIDAPFRTINKKLDGGEELEILDKEKLFKEKDD